MLVFFTFACQTKLTGVKVINNFRLETDNVPSGETVGWVIKNYTESFLRINKQ